MPSERIPPATFAQRLAGEAGRLKGRLSETLSVSEREVLQRRLEQIENASLFDSWISSARPARPK
jgi:hypothetical protein